MEKALAFKVYIKETSAWGKGMHAISYSMAY